MLLEDVLLSFNRIHALNKVIVGLHFFLKLLKAVLCEFAGSQHAQDRANAAPNRSHNGHKDNIRQCNHLPALMMPI